MKTEIPSSHFQKHHAQHTGFFSHWSLVIGHCAAAIFFAIGASSAHARINVTTLPNRDSTQLTIYNSVDLTLVKETRHLTFRKGMNRLEFSWANTLIDPTSVDFRALTHADKVEVLDASFPPRVTNTLEWRIQSEFAGDVQVEIRYFTSGISWSSDYVANADKQEKTMELAGFVRVNNNSGEDYENAQIRLVVGTVRLVETIVQLASATLPRPAGAPAPAAPVVFARRAKGLMEKDAGMVADAAEAKPREVVKEGLSEYFLYTVEGRDTIPTGWSKRLPSFAAADVPVTSYYKFEKERWDGNVMRFYKFKNDKAGKLGTEPLPDGDVKAFRFTTPDKLLSLVGRTNVKYIPIGEEVEMELGNDLEVRVEPKLMGWEKTNLRFNNNGDIDGWTVRETWETEVQNSKDIPIVLDVRRNFSGDWTIETTAKFEKMDANKVKFVMPLKPLEQRKWSYTLTTNFGTNATK